MTFVSYLLVGFANVGWQDGALAFPLLVCFQVVFYGPDVLGMVHVMSFSRRGDRAGRGEEGRRLVDGDWR